jgi:CxxC motif-containing protein
MVTTTVAIDHALWPRLPVRSQQPVPRQLVAEICRALRSVRVVAPVTLGDVLVENVLGCGVAIVAARDMAAC